MEPTLARAVNKLRSPYNVNSAGLLTAGASQEDVSYLMKNVLAIVAERDRMQTALANLKFLQPLPSRANFILAHEVKGLLKRNNILIRAYGEPRLREYLRFTIGTPEQDEEMLRVLRPLGMHRKE